MKVQNVKSGRNYTILSSKGNVIAAWCAHIKPVKIKIDGETVDVFANPERSNYIYFRFKSIARCVWAKDPKEFDFLKEKALKVVDHGRDAKPDRVKVPSAKTAGVKAKATPKAPQRPIKVIKKADVLASLASKVKAPEAQV